LVILHHLRLCYNYLLSFIFGHRRHRGHRNNHYSTNNSNNNSDGGGISIVSLKNLFKRNRQQLTFDNGIQIYIGDQIAEGGFSFVFEAFAVVDNNGGGSSSAATSGDSRTKRYALKRINCGDYELVQSCRHEAGIHRSLPSDHPNLLELLGLKFDNTTTDAAADNGGGGGASSSSSSRRREEYNVCYMLFPYLPYSLRGEITLRNILSVNQENHPPNRRQHYNNTNSNNNNTRRQPFTTYEVLHLFSGILDGLLAMHSANISHRDVKLENILLSPNSYGDHDHHHHNHTHHGSSGQRRRMRSRYTPILMDFGSAGPLSSPNLTSRQCILQIIELASIHTTLSYRPPELTEGCCNLRHGSEGEGEGCKLDYGKVDVWSLGCVLFGLLHGVSPFEMEFVKSSGSGGGSDGQQYGLVRVVDCTNLKILDEVPFPPWAGGGLGHDNNNNSSSSSVGGEGGDGSNGKYPLSIYKFIRYMVQHDRLLRPNIQDVAKRFGELYYELLHEEWIPYSDKRGGGSSSRMGGVNDESNEEREHDDFDSLIASRDFV
jgi:serine/threonine kinase 16